MIIGQIVDIPVRHDRKPVIAQVERGVVLGFKNGLAVVEWPCGLQVPYYRDQIGPAGAFQAGQRWPIRDRVTTVAA